MNLFYLGGGIPRDIVANVMVCVVGEFELQSRYYVHFTTRTLGEEYELLPANDKKHHYSFSKRVVLALSNPQWLICH